MKDKEIKELLSKMVILVDSREHLPSHITDTFDKYNIKWKRKKLNSADYTAYIPKEEGDIYADISIERKMGIEEICNNLINQRLRFKREFERKETDIIIMIENDTYKDIICKNYHNKVEPNSLLASLHSISREFDIPFIFIDKESSPLYIYKTLYYDLRNKLKNNKINA